MTTAYGGGGQERRWKADRTPERTERLARRQKGEISGWRDSHFIPRKRRKKVSRTAGGGSYKEGDTDPQEIMSVEHSGGLRRCGGRGFQRGEKKEGSTEGEC